MPLRIASGWHPLAIAVLCIVAASSVIGLFQEIAPKPEPKLSLYEFIQDAAGDAASLPGADIENFNLQLAAQGDHGGDVTHIALRRVGGRNVLEIDGLLKAGCLELTRAPMRGVDYIAVANNMPGAIDSVPLFDAKSGAAHAACRRLPTSAIALVLKPALPGISLKAVAAGTQRFPSEAPANGGRPPKL